MNLKRTFTLSLLLLAAMLVIPALAAMPGIVAIGQVPPPQLPGAPDQSPLCGGMLVFLAAMLFGVWRMRQARK